MPAGLSKAFLNQNQPPIMSELIQNPHRKWYSSPTLWLIIVSTVAIFVRLLLVVFYQPVSFGDTPSYFRLAETVLKGFVGYDGTRTPGYPVFLALTGNDRTTWLIQLLLGLFTTLLLFYIGLKLTGKAWFGGLIGLSHTLNLGQLFFEANLLTEALTTFLMVLTMAGIMVWLLYRKWRGFWLALILGTASTLTLLVRPLFIYLPFYLFTFLLVESRLATPKVKPEPSEDSPDPPQPAPPRMALRLVLGFLIPVVLLLGGWLSFIHKNFNEWSLTTMNGYHLVQHTGSFFEYVPDEYASLRDTYIKYRDAQIDQYGTQTNAIWDAIPEMSKVSGYSFYALSRVLAHISIDLILHYPFLYLKNAAGGWWMFWRVPVYWSAEALRIPALSSGVSLLITLERGLIFITNLAFILGSISFVIIESLSAVRRRSSPLFLRQQNPTLRAYLWLLLGNIWIASVLQTLLDHGDNPRFLVPLQSLVILWVAAFIFQWVISRKSSFPGTA